MANCKPSDKIYDLLVETYLNTENTTVLSTEATGILFNKGYINDPNNIEEYMSKIELKRKFYVESVEERKEMIRKLENGELK